MVILKIKKMYYFTFLAALFMGLSCTGKETPDYKEPPHVTPPLTGVESTYDKADGAIRLVSYNVGSFSKYNDSIEMIAKMMLELQELLLAPLQIIFMRKIKEKQQKAK